MNENENLVPKRRFKEFTNTGTWEERKLKDIAQFNLKTVLPDEFEYVDLESVVGTEMISHRTESKDQAPSRAQRLAQKGDVFYQTVRPYQMNNYLYDLPYDNYVFSTGYAQMRPNIDSYFLLNSVQNKQFVQHVLDRSTGTSYPAINSSDLSNIEIHVPSKLSEQQKIGAFFQSIDDTITLHQRKLDLLKEQKKGYLQKMFPKNGAKVPELRFKGFTGDWEERKLGELVEQIIREVPKPNKPYYRMSVRSHAKGTFKQFVDNPENVAMDKLFVVKKDDLVVNITFAWEHAIAVVNEENDGLLVSHRFPTYRADGKSDIEFLHHVVSKENFRRKLEFISPGGAGRNRVLNKKDFLKLKIFVPKIEEQQKIGSFFKQLDNTIALHQRKLDLLKEQKKGFLQKMFV